MIDARDAYRFREQACASIRCNRGRVVDFSIRGVRLACLRAWAPGVRKPLRFEYFDTEIEIEAEAVWCRRSSPFRHTVGIRYVGVNAQAASALDAIAARLTPPGLLRLPTGEHIGLTTARPAA